MNVSPRLAITIPTYNRADLLAVLLDSISQDFPEWPADLEVVVIDNASTDATRRVVEQRSGAGFPVRLLVNSANNGMDSNLAACFDVTSATYLWQLGDDEVLYKGAARGVLSLCRKHEFGLLHMESTPFKKGGQSAQFARSISDDMTAIQLDRKALFRRANILLTFISANVINRHAVLAHDASFDPYVETGTFLPQLAWIYAALKACDCHLYIRSPMFGALSGNSGGYRLVEVFGSNLLAITDRQLGQIMPKARSIMANAALSVHFPGMLSVQFDKVTSRNTFEHENIAHALHQTFRGSAYFYLFVRPILSKYGFIRCIGHLVVRAFNKVNRKIGFALL